MSQADHGPAPESSPRVAQLPARPRLPDFFRVVPMDADRVLVCGSGRTARLTGAGLGTWGAQLLWALDGHSSPEELADRFGVAFEQVQQLLDHLQRQAIVHDRAEEDRLPSHLADVVVTQLASELGLSPESARVALATSRVAVVGLGPVARLAAQHIVGAGVAHLVLADDRVVSEMDEAVLGAVGRPNRQRSEATADQARCIEAHRPPGRSTTVAVVGDDGIAGCLRQVDLVLTEVDLSGQRAEALNAACLEAGAPVLFHSATTFDGKVGPLVGSGQSACYECLRIREDSHRRHYEEHGAYRRYLRASEHPDPEPALLPGTAAMMAGLLSTEAVRFLAGFAGTVGDAQVLVADLRRLQVHSEGCLAVPDCPACGGPPPRKPSS